MIASAAQLGPATNRTKPSTHPRMSVSFESIRLSYTRVTLEMCRRRHQGVNFSTVLQLLPRERVLSLPRAANEAARVHHPARRRGGVAAGGIRSDFGTARGRLFGRRLQGGH